MLIEVKRTTLKPKWTLGELYINGEFMMYTVEDTVREVQGVPVSDWKIPHVTAIPHGEYNVTMSMSNRFKKIMPELHDVVGFAGVRIHAGNTAEDTEGCIIVGMQKRIDGVGSSRIAVSKLYPLIQQALDRGEKVTIKIA